MEQKNQNILLPINPQRIYGLYYEGWAMDLHTKSSHRNDHGGFDNNYTPLGNYLNKIKYHSEKQYVSIVGTAASRFILGKYINSKFSGNPFPFINRILPVPPSKLDRPFQPVDEIVKIINQQVHIPIIHNVVEKVKKTKTLKNLSQEEKESELKDAFIIKNTDEINHKKILLFDDLYQTGTTVSNIVKNIKEEVPNCEIYVLTLTKTRTPTGLYSQ